MPVQTDPSEQNWDSQKLDTEPVETPSIKMGGPNILVKEFIDEGTNPKDKESIFS
jgi:hypothetical protein